MPDPSSSTHEVTRLLNELQQGQSEAADQVIRHVYDELHALAASYMRGERADHTLQTTALVNEAYLRLVNQRAVSWQSRSHFFGIAAQAMRRILVDHARRQHAAKRESALRVTLNDDVPHEPQRSLDLVALDEALHRLGELDERQARVVELRFFAGLDLDETAQALGISRATVKRDWTFAKAWLERELSGAPTN
jgi:RNA polymerase sigma factor (TIGR02999 family)